MKRSCISFIVLALALSVSAQAPLSFKYQAYLRNPDGSIRGSEFVTLQIKIVQGSVSGPAVYTETHNTSTNNHGMVSVSVGKGSTSSNMAAIQWDNGPFFLNISVNGVNLGTTEILSVPFALYSNHSADSFSGVYADLTGKPNLARVATTGNYSDLINTPSLSTVAITGSYTSLLNVPLTFTPSVHAHLEADISDLAHYTDDSISGLELVFQHWDKDTADDFSGSYLDLTDAPPFTAHYTDDSIDGTEAAFIGWDMDVSNDFSGSFNDLTDVPLTLDRDSTDNFSGSFTDLTNIPPTLDLDSTNNFYGDMRGLPITNVGNPVNPQDAATRAYVDASSGSFSGSFNDLTDVPPLLDRDSTDNFSGVYSDLTSIPATFTPAAHTHTEAQISDLIHYTDADIQGNEAAFNAWDKNAADDFNGNYASLTNAPTQIGYFGGNMQSKVITNLAMPSAPGSGTDAANRAYVDALEARVAALETALTALTARVATLEGYHPPPPLPQ